MKTKHLISRLGALAISVLALTSTAQAGDLRSWDQKIDQSGKRFVVLSAFRNEAVLDKETQLVWWRAPYTSTLRWATANHQCLIGVTGGRAGWRLPTYPELSSLMGDNQTLPAGHPFLNLPTANNFAWFWSATKHESEYPTQPHVYTRSLTLAGGLVQPLQEYAHVLCVRGPTS